MHSLPPIVPGSWVWALTAMPSPGVGQVQMWRCQPGGHPGHSGKRMPPHPEPALPGLSVSALCRPGGCGETPHLHPLAPSPGWERLQFSPPSGWGPRGQSHKGQAASPAPCTGRAWKRLLACLSVCSSGWCQPWSLVRTKLSFSAESRTRNAGKGQLWNLLLLTCRVGPGYLLRPLTQKTEMRLQGVLWTVERADP